ncbi:MAG: hypothetical protein AB1758_02600 [Candidatus Eremiobacterota bacterium]
MDSLRGGYNGNFPLFDPNLTIRAGQNAAESVGAPVNGNNGWTGVQARYGADQRMEQYRGIVGNQGPAPQAGGQPGGNLMDKYIGDMTEEELKRVFGSDASRIQELAAKQPRITPGQLAPLRKDTEGMDAVIKLLSERSDLTYDDVVQKDAKGNVRVSGVVKDPASMDLMTARNDIKPGELNQMYSSFAQTLRQPALAQEAYKVSLDLLKNRTDVKPMDLGGLMSRISRGVGGNSKAGGQDGGQGAAATLEMFKTGATLMKTRQDISVDDVGKLTDSITALGGKKDDKSPMKMANAMHSAADFLMNHKGSNVNDVVQLAGTVKAKVPGESGEAADDRFNLFEQGLNLMKAVPGLNAGHIGNMLDKAQQGPPPRQGADLINAFRSMGDGLVNGTGRLSVMADPLQRQDPEGKRAQDGEVLLDKHGRAVTPQAGTATLRPDQTATVNTGLNAPKLDDKGQPIRPRPDGQQPLPGQEGAPQGNPEGPATLPGPQRREPTLG